MNIFLFISLFSWIPYVYSVPPLYCLRPLNTSDCKGEPTLVFTYYKPGSRCEIDTWYGCPTANKFPNEYACSNLCIFRFSNDRNHYPKIDNDRIFLDDGKDERNRTLTPGLSSEKVKPDADDSKKLKTNDGASDNIDNDGDIGDIDDSSDLSDMNNLKVPKDCLGKLNPHKCEKIPRLIFTYDPERKQCLRTEWFVCPTKNVFPTKRQCTETCVNPQQKSRWFQMLSQSRAGQIMKINEILDDIVGNIVVVDDSEGAEKHKRKLDEEKAKLHEEKNKTTKKYTVKPRSTKITPTTTKKTAGSEKEIPQTSTTNSNDVQTIQGITNEVKVTKKETPSQVTKKTIPSKVTEKDIQPKIIEEEIPSKVTEKAIPSKVTETEIPSKVTEKEIPSKVTEKEIPSKITKNEFTSHVTEREISSQVTTSEHGKTNAEITETKTEITTSITTTENIEISTINNVKSTTAENIETTTKVVKPTTKFVKPTTTLQPTTTEKLVESTTTSTAATTVKMTESTTKGSTATKGKPTEVIVFEQDESDPFFK